MVTQLPLLREDLSLRNSLFPGKGQNNCLFNFSTAEFGEEFQKAICTQLYMYWVGFRDFHAQRVFLSRVGLNLLTFSSTPAIHGLQHWRASVWWTYMQREMNHTQERSEKLCMCREHRIQESGYWNIVELQILLTIFSSNSEKS